jgi:FtsZ-binding cell division protein ZapB
MHHISKEELLHQNAQLQQQVEDYQKQIAILQIQNKELQNHTTQLQKKVH